IQLQYTTNDGGVFAKVITASLPVVTDRFQAESNVNTTVIALQTIHESAGLAQVGKYFDARINLVSTLRLLQRAMKSPQNQRDYLSYVVQAEKLDGFMREIQQQELVLGAKDESAR